MINVILTSNKLDNICNKLLKRY